MSATAISRNNVIIRLTPERWQHIAEQHGELIARKADVLKTVENPTRILAGSAGELLATREFEPGKWLVIVYKELDGDGFIITAFLTRRARSLERREQIWP
jgi:hypothetical protein